MVLFKKKQVLSASNLYLDLNAMVNVSIDFCIAHTKGLYSLITTS